jgi:hypothetical protein
VSAAFRTSREGVFFDWFLATKGVSPSSGRGVSALLAVCVRGVNWSYWLLDGRLRIGFLVLFLMCEGN